MTDDSTTKFEMKVENIVVCIMQRSLQGNWDNIYGNTIEMSERDLARTDDELRARHFPVPPFITRRFALQTKVCLNLLKNVKDDAQEIRKLLASFYDNKKLTYDYLKGFCAISCDLSVLMERADEGMDFDEGTYLAFCNALKSLHEAGEQFRRLYKPTPSE